MSNSTTRRFLLFLATVVSLAGANSSYALKNQLQNHSSPYLALHATDPVAWQDWGEDTVKQARREGKLIYLSIGYFSCHWCHVMQRESYKNKKIAAYLNSHFIPVKIDRELEPALDARMIAFTEETKGISGWPLNVFLTPEGYPLYSLLYAPPEDFLAVVNQVQQLWVKDKANLSAIAAGGRKTVTRQPKAVVDKAKLAIYSGKLVEQAIQLADGMQGGFGEQSKFPSVPQLLALLDQLKKKKNKNLEKLFRLTLDQMASQGLHDHIGGGFFRYTTDPAWHVPHFEKMLYDNALLARLYLLAGKHFDNQEYLRRARQTLSFMDRELLHETGAMMASLSALDNEGREGAYYTFDKKTLRKTLSELEYSMFIQVYGMEDAAPFDYGYLPVVSMTPGELAHKKGVSEEHVTTHLMSARKKLFGLRQSRSLPRDDKLLAGWNGLALTAYMTAARELDNEGYIERAKGIRDYLAESLWNGRDISRSISKGKSIGQSSLEDYAYVAEGLLHWARHQRQGGDYEIVRKILNRAWQHFYDAQGWRMSPSSFIAREEGSDILMDGPMPSPSAVLIRTSLEYSKDQKDKAMKKRALSALNRGHDILQENSFWLASHIGAMELASGRD